MSLPSPPNSHKVSGSPLGWATYNVPNRTVVLPVGAVTCLVALAAMVTMGLVSTEFSYMETHLPTPVTANGGPFKRSCRVD